MLLLALCLLGPTDSALPAEAVVLYRTASQLYDQGEYQRAQQALEQLTRHEPAAPLAHFALGNLHVTLSESKTGADRRRDLLRAIHYYRLALDAHCPPPLNAEDVRFNLELAKQRLQTTSANGGDDAASPDAQAKAQASSKGDSTTADDQSESGKVDPSAPQAQKDQGIVRKPLPGLGFQDPGPMSRDEAQELLQKALERMEQQRRSSLGPFRKKPPRTPDDY
jgi:tetratricopeptide (TPR) repeat protein